MANAAIMTRHRHRVCATLLLFGLAFAVCSSADTLRQTIVAKGVDLTGLNSPNLDKVVTDGEVLDEADLFLTAYYLSDGSGTLNGPIYIEMLDKTKHTWTHKQVDASSVKPHAGSISDITRTKNGIYLFLHCNPSAGTSILLSPSLEFRGLVAGRVLGDYTDGTVVYANNTVHFAPTRPAEVSLYDPKSKRDRKIYPTKPYQAIRLGHIAKVKAAYDKLGEQWFKEHNHHGDPERFSNYIGAAATNDTTDSLVFVTTFEDAETPPRTTQVVYVYRNVHRGAKLQYREILLDDVKREFGDVPLAALLEPQTLEAVFADQG